MTIEDIKGGLKVTSLLDQLTDSTTLDLSTWLSHGLSSDSFNEVQKKIENDSNESTKYATKKIAISMALWQELGLSAYGLLKTNVDEYVGQFVEKFMYDGNLTINPSEIYDVQKIENSENDALESLYYSSILGVQNPKNRKPLSEYGERNIFELFPLLRPALEMKKNELDFIRTRLEVKQIVTQAMQEALVDYLQYSNGKKLHDLMYLLSDIKSLFSGTNDTRINSYQSYLGPIIFDRLREFDQEGVIFSAYKQYLKYEDKRDEGTGIKIPKNTMYKTLYEHLIPTAKPNESPYVEVAKEDIKENLDKWVVLFHKIANDPRTQDGMVNFVQQMQGENFFATNTSDAILPLVKKEAEEGSVFLSDIEILEKQNMVQLYKDFLENVSLAIDSSENEEAKNQKISKSLADFSTNWVGFINQMRQKTDQNLTYLLASDKHSTFQSAVEMQLDRAKDGYEDIESREDWENFIYRLGTLKHDQNQNKN